MNGKLVRRSRLRSGAKVSGTLKEGCDPKKVESWTNITAARILLKEVVDDVSKGTISVGNDPTQLHYSDLRKLYLNYYAEQEMATLLTNATTGEIYVGSLKHLDAFFGNMKASRIEASIDAYKAERKAAGAANATINRSLAALNRMFSLAQKKHKLQSVPFIKMLPEPKQPRQGFLEIQDYEKLHNALPGYVQPLLQVGYYTGMRLGEILNLKWTNIDLAENCIRLTPDQTKNESARNIPLIDGLPQTLEAIRRANPNATENDFVFLNDKGQPIVSFIRSWRTACVKAAIKTRKNGVEIVSHFEKDGKEVEGYIEGAIYYGFLFHDLRRSAIRNLIRAGVDATTAKKISGHKTDEVFERYNIISGADLQDAAAKVNAMLKEKRNVSAPPARLKVVEK